MNYVFMTDASCDLTPQQVKEIGVEVLPMEFQIEDKTFMHYPDCRMMSLTEFYSRMKDGAVSKTTQINFANYSRYFENYLKAGKDVLYVGISTGLSGSFNTATLAASELKEKYPERRIEIIDPYCASAGLGYLIYLAGKKYSANASMDEVIEYIEDVKQTVCHWFVVDDLDQLKRGGRISSVSAAFGKALQIKPLISVDEKGKLVNVAKIRGASNVIDTLVERVKRDGENLKKSVIFVAHADNPDGAKQLRKAVKGMCREVQICDIGPVIGSHVGSGMIAVIFPGKRNLK